MEIERRILRSTSVLLSANLVSQLSSFGFVVLFARAYGLELFGEYSFALAFGSLLSVFVSLGTNSLLLRKCSKDHSEWRRYSGTLFPVQMILAFASWLLIVGVALLLDFGQTEFRIVAIVSSFQLLTPVWGIFAIGFTATERMAYVALSDAGSRVLVLVAGGAASIAGASPEQVLMVFPVSAILVLLILSRLASKEFGVPSFRFEPRVFMDFAREALPFFGIVALSIIYGRIGLILLRMTTGAESAGIFASAERLVMAAGILHNTIGNASFPALVRLATEDGERFRQLAGRITRLVLLLTLPAATVLHIFAQDLIVFLFGDDYLEAADVLRLVAWLLAIRGLAAILNNLGIALNDQRNVLASKAIGIGILVALCVILAPTMGAVGLAIALFASQLFSTALLYALLRPSQHVPSLVRPAFPVLVACALTIAFSLLLNDRQLWLRSCLVIVLGTALLWFFRAVRSSDIAFLRQLLRGKYKQRTP